MTDTKNALAELAERMSSPVELMPGTGDSLIGLNRNQLEAYKKAQRIVAELAKVEDWTNDFGADEPAPYSSVSAIKKCLAIAEEGVNNGK